MGMTSKHWQILTKANVEVTTQLLSADVVCDRAGEMTGDTQKQAVSMSDESDQVGILQTGQRVSEMPSNGF